MITFALIYLLAALVVTIWAAKQGRMWYVYGPLALFASPLLMFIVLACLGKTDARKVKELRKMQELMDRANEVTVTTQTKSANDANMRVHERVEEIVCARRAKGIDA